MPLDLDAIEARANAATEGPWLAETICDDSDALELEITGQGGIVLVAERLSSRKNATFIAAARTDIPALVGAVKALAMQVAELRATIAAERGDPAGAPIRDDGCDWEYDADEWEWTRKDGGVDDEDEPRCLSVRHRGFWLQDGPIEPGKPWFWLCEQEIGQGDIGATFAEGCAATAREAMLAADAACVGVTIRTVYPEEDAP